MISRDNFLKALVYKRLENQQISGTAKRILERLGIPTSSLFVKI
jgi:hypothetical protein